MAPVKIPVVERPWRPPPATVEDARDKDPGAEGLYPRWVLNDASDALVMFCAGFHGMQDAYWVYEAGLLATCVDSDAVRLGEMEAVYPADWGFVASDAFEFIDDAVGTGMRWDVVSLDPFNDLMDECVRYLPKLVEVARQTIVLGTETHTRLRAPDGWGLAESLRRSDWGGGIYWKVLRRL